MKLKSIGKNVTEVEFPDGTLVLFSYETPVACHIPGMGFYKTTEKYSRTTSKHIGKFLGRHGAKAPMTITPEALAHLTVN